MISDRQRTALCVIAGASPSEHWGIDEMIHRLSTRFANLPVRTVAEVVNGAYGRFAGSPIRE
ncbi:three-helix bundle dimerization domain-containing protein [Mycobacterium sp. AT1]|uniref:three-helix bundle dimerization domain-containing protein n=1 Tax=Mycobacterium sp. AT1 TaxID=1961706 RepID=UPI002692E954